MKKNILGIFAIAVVASVSCQKENFAGDADADGKTVIPAGIVTTKTVLGESADNARKVYWTSGDDIAVNGSKSAVLENVEENASNATFVFDDVLSVPYNAVYPASVWSDESSVILPSVQEVCVGSFASGAMPMAAYASDAASLPLHFHHLCAVVKINLTVAGDSDEIAYIEFRGNASEQVSGKFGVGYESATLSPASADESDKAVRVNVNRAIPSDGVCEVYIVVPEGEYTKGFTVKVVDELGHYMEKSATDAKTLEAGRICMMPSFGFEPTGTETGVEIASASELVAFAKAYNAGEYAEVDPLFVTLTDNIVFDETANAEFVSIGNIPSETETNYFNGSFNGNNKIISGFVSNKPLFGYAGGAAYLYDLTLDESCSFTVNAESPENFGALVGYHKGEMKNCVNNAGITLSGVPESTATQRNIGGLVGRMTEGAVYDCTMAGAIAVQNTFASEVDIHLGGLVGNNTNAAGIVRNSTLTGSVDWQGKVLKSSGKRLCLGGIAGRIAGTIENCTVAAADTDEASVLNTSGNETYTTALGGIVGVVDETGTVSGAINNGRVTTKMQRLNDAGENDASRYEYIGGIAGMNDGKILNSSNTVFVQTRSSVNNIAIGGVVGYSRTDSEVSSCENSGNITARTSGVAPYGAAILRIGGVIGLSAAKVSDISNSGPMEISRIENSTSTIVAYGGCIGQSEVVEIAGNHKVINTGAVNVNTTQKYKYITQGGVVGRALAPVSGVENYGKVSMTTDYTKNYLGGAVGFIMNTTISDCINKANVEMVKAVTGNIGGITASVDATSKVETSKSFGDITGTAAKVGGIAGVSVAGASIAGCGFGGTLNGVEITDAAQVCSDANATLSGNYLWNGIE